jgi:replicative DNA helicase
MRKFDPRTEMQVLASICNSGYEDRQFKYLSLVKRDHFGTPHVVEIFDRITKSTDESGKIPSFTALADDPRLSQTARQLVSTSRAQRYRNETDFKQGVATLATYFKARCLLQVHEQITAVLNGDAVPDNFEAVENSVESALFQMRSDGIEEKIYHGASGKTDMYDLAKRAIMHPHTGKRFKTGWGEFDDQIGGLEPGNVMLITANTGGGKSVAALTMMTNMYRGHNQNVTYISLEMNEREVMERMLSNVTGIPYDKIRLGRLNTEEKKALMREFKRFNDSSSGRYSIYSPKQDYTIEQLFNQVQGYGNEVIILDYLGLVKPGNYGKNTSEEFQLRQMTRYAKRAAERMGCAIILLAQLNDEGQIMYSKGIGHHVHYWLKWFFREEDETRGFVIVENGKSRNSKKKDLYATTDFAHMRMDNVANPPGLEEFKKQRDGNQAQQGSANAGGSAPRKQGSGIKQSGPPKPGRPQPAAMQLFDEHL